MRLTTFADYTVRTLMYLALHPGRFITIAEVAEAWRISPNHLMKVVRHLGATGDVTTLRGPHGGVRLGRPASEIRLGMVVRSVEPAMILSTDGDSTGLIAPDGPWGDVLGKAIAEFMAVLDAHTLADLVADPDRMGALLASDRAGQLGVDRG